MAVRSGRRHRPGDEGLVRRSPNKILTNGASKSDGQIKKNIASLCEKLREEAKEFEAEKAKMIANHEEGPAPNSNVFEFNSKLSLKV